MIKAFWYSKPHLAGENLINFGDELSHILLSKISGQKIKWINPKKQLIYERYLTKHVLAIGSILHFGAKNSLVWGSGLIEKKSKASNCTYYAVRGEHTRKELLNRGFSVPPVFGDPALLTPKYFTFPNTLNKYKVGIIPHYVEFDQINNFFKQQNFSSEFKMIDLRNPINQVLQEINECEFIISSSLHGVIVPQAYNIPTLRISFTNKIVGDGIKYADYFASVGISNYEPKFLNASIFEEKTILFLLKNNENNLLINNDLIRIQDELLKVKPF